jgi:HPr kinase/phosphorylase
LDQLLVEEFTKAEAFKLDIELVTGDRGLKNRIEVQYVQRLGLALTGFSDFLVRGQVQILGQEAISYLRMIPIKRREEIVKALFDFGLACFVVTRDLKIPEEFLAHAERTGTPVFRTPLPTHVFFERITKYLDVRFAKSESLHGVLVDVHGVGILILGESGIGKSECALDLLLKGHRLVADDVVILKRIPPGIIRGQGTDIVKFHMEIRGLGVINVRQLFGIAAIRDAKKVHMVVKLVHWNQTTEYDRVGLDDNFYDLLGVDLPLIVLPVAPGRNIAGIIEVAAKNRLLKLEGFDAAQEFQKQILERIAEESEEALLEEPE